MIKYFKSHLTFDYHTQCKLRPTFNLSQYENSINQWAAAADGTSLYGPMRAQLCLYGPMGAQLLAETTTQDGG